MCRKSTPNRISPKSNEENSISKGSRNAAATDFTESNEFADFYDKVVVEEIKLN